MLRKLSFCSAMVTYLVGCKAAGAGGGKDLLENEINIEESGGERGTVLSVSTWIQPYLKSNSSWSSPF